MKNLLQIAALFCCLFCTTGALAYCPQLEAQVIGQALDVRAVELDKGVTVCFYKVNFTYYHESKVCPLTADFSSATEILDATCEIKNGSSVSGILIYKDGHLYFE